MHCDVINRLKVTDYENHTLATLYGECSFLYQNVLMPPYGRLFGMVIYPDLDVKTTYLNFSQCLSTFTNIYYCKGSVIIFGIHALDSPSPNKNINGPSITQQ